MPKIPQYNAQLGLTKDVPAIRVDASAYGQQARAVGGIADAAFNVGEKIQKIRQADAAFNVGEKIQKIRQADEINQRSLQADKMIKNTLWNAYEDNELEGYEAKYTQQLDEVKKSVLEGIKDGKVASEVGLRLDSAILNSSMQVKQYYRNKVIDSDKATLADTLDSLQTDYVNSISPKDKQKALTGIELAIKETADRGSISRTDAKNTLINVKTKLPERQAAFDAANDPETYFKNRGSYGIAADKLADTDKIAEKTLSEVKIITLQEQFKNQKDFISTLETKTINEALSELEEKKNSMVVDDKWADSMRKAILSNAGINEEKMNEFESDIIMSIADISSQYKSKESKKRTHVDSEKYLNALRDIEIKINNGVASGYLTRQQQKKHLETLYNSTTAEATQNLLKGAGRWLSYNVVDADKYLFKSRLSGADRFKAIREFYWTTNGEDLDKKEGSRIASEIADKMLGNIRENILEENDRLIEEKETIPSFSSEEAIRKANPPSGRVRVGGQLFDWVQE